MLILVARDVIKLALPGFRHSVEWWGLPTRLEWALASRPLMDGESDHGSDLIWMGLLDVEQGCAITTAKPDLIWLGCCDLRFHNTRAMILVL